MTRLRRRTLSMAVAGGATTLALLAAASPAAAQPATTVSYPAWSSATRYVGAAFDTCTAPPLASLQSWGASPVWDKLRDGHWVPDYYLASPSKTSYTASVPRC